MLRPWSWRPSDTAPRCCPLGRVTPVSFHTSFYCGSHQRTHPAERLLPRAQSHRKKSKNGGQQGRAARESRPPFPGVGGEVFACVFASPRSSPKTVESLPCLIPDTYGTAVNLSQQNQVCFLDTFERFSCSPFSSSFSFKPHLAKAVEMLHQCIQVGVGGV